MILHRNGGTYSQMYFRNVKDLWELKPLKKKKFKGGEITLPVFKT